MPTTSPAPPKLRFDAITKSFPPSAKETCSTIVLENLNLSLEAGEFLVIVGPSGSGKSTLLDLAAGLSAPTHGEVLLDGSSVSGPGPERSVVFQNYALFPWKSARDNIILALDAAGIDRRQHTIRADQALSLVGLQQSADRYPHQLSGGMKQRIAIARALSVEPKVLLMDEPFGALDAQSRETLQIELRSLWQRTGMTIMFITHDIDEALVLGQRIAILGASPGRVIDILDLPFTADSDIDTIRSSADYAALRQYIRTSLTPRYALHNGGLS
ncbi:ABC transporter ATP-binding protein [Neokomagataea anthophila]|uniref:ABC transporter ATP-binding protein n=1 Tax=Neokomagataea anthophila TaxID=2826925 RepID=A0ABS5E907_9PROT|nr:ABC transporter ATP-binding protein [Neokomagataea anthophila]